MLYYSDKNKIRRKQAFKKFETLNFGAWGTDLFQCDVIQEVQLRDVYEHWSFEATANLYFNDVLIDKSYSTFNDFYGFGDSIKSTQETLDLLVEKYKITETDKLEIRVNYRQIKCYYYNDNGKLREVPSDWYLCYEDIKAFHDLGDERFDNEVVKKLNIQKIYVEGDYINIHSSLKDGFIIDEEKIDAMLQNIIKEEGLTVSDDDITLN